MKITISPPLQKYNSSLYAKILGRLVMCKSKPYELGILFSKAGNLSLLLLNLTTTMWYTVKMDPHRTHPPSYLPYFPSFSAILPTLLLPLQLR